MKKFIGFITILCLILSLTGCAKCISTEYENVEVTIIDEYYRGSYSTPRRVGKVTTMKHHSAVYRITVEYDGVEYSINSSDTYNDYKDKIGQTTTGTLEIRKYDDGSVRQSITDLVDLNP